MRRIIVFAVILSLSFSVNAQELKPKPYDLGISMGIVGPCDVEAAWYDDFKPSETVTFHKDNGFLLRVLADYYILPFVGISASINYSPIMFPDDILYYDNGKYNRIKKDEVHMFELCGGIRFRYAFTERISIKPGFSLGYGFTTATTSYARETGFEMNADVQLVYRLNNTWNVFLDTGLLTQQYGGIDDVAYIRGGPAPYLNFGIGL